MVVYLSDMVATESSMLLWESATKHQQIPNSKFSACLKMLIVKNAKIECNCLKN